MLKYKDGIMSLGNLNPLLFSLLVILMGIAAVDLVVTNGLSENFFISGGDGNFSFSPNEGSWHINTHIPAIIVAPITLMLGLWMLIDSCKTIAKEGIIGDTDWGCCCCDDNKCKMKEEEEDTCTK
jgi:hypothetical protein